MKKFLALILTIVTALSFATFLSACNDNNNPPPKGPQGTAGLIYTFDNRGATLVSCIDVAEGTTEIVIPKTVKNETNGQTYNVIAIGENVFNVNENDIPFTSFTLPETLQEIKGYAFAGVTCESITLPASLKIIEIGAFEGANINSIVFKNTSGWMYHAVPFSQIQQDGIRLDHPIVNIDIANASVAADFLTTVDADFDYSEACEGTVTPTPVAGKQPTGLAGLTIYKK